MGLELSQTVVNPLEALEIFNEEETETEMKTENAFVVNTMLFYHCSDQLFEVYAGKLREAIEERSVVFFLPISVADFSAKSLRQLLTSFRRQVKLNI